MKEGSRSLLSGGAAELPVVGAQMSPVPSLGTGCRRQESRASAERAAMRPHRPGHTSGKDK